jgi:hypothetical protein
VGGDGGTVAGLTSKLHFLAGLASDAAARLENFIPRVPDASDARPGEEGQEVRCLLAMVKGGRRGFCQALWCGGLAAIVTSALCAFVTWFT